MCFKINNKINIVYANDVLYFTLEVLNDSKNKHSIKSDQKSYLFNENNSFYEIILSNNNTIHI